MITIQEAAELLQVEPKMLSSFEEPDPFNNNQIIKGYLCRQSDHRYGALVICSVDNEDTKPQVIYCTPKLHYPFERGSKYDEERKYNFPRFVKVEVYHKLDGTNILLYSYRNNYGRRFITYKTRLTPIVKANTYGSFVSLWKEILRENPNIGIDNYLKTGAVSKSYELYGYRNHHLVKYDIPLSAQLLFLVQQDDASIIPPRNFGVSPIAECNSKEDLIKLYERLREEANSNNTLVNAKTDEEYIEGIEGYVFYVLDITGKWQMFKCKAEQAEQIHWATGSLPKQVILPTIWSALENTTDITLEYIKELLLEEFSVQQVEKSINKIQTCISIIQEKVELRARVKILYKMSNLDINIDGKGPVMRYISGYINKDKMRHAFTALVELGIAER